MSWVCTMCGYENDENASVCVCGNMPDEVGSTDDDDSSDIFKDIDDKRGNRSSVLDKPPVEKPQAKKIQVKVPEKNPPVKPVESDDEVLIKEVEGWRFTYSGSESCVYLGTPALQAFRLKLTLKDLQELMDSMYEMTGVAKPKAAVELQKKDVLELISMIDDMIEDKRSKFKIVFSDDELRSLSDIMNEKLND